MLIINYIFERVLSDYRWYRKFIGGRWRKVQTVAEKRLRQFWIFEKTSNRY